MAARALAVAVTVAVRAARSAASTRTLAVAVAIAVGAAASALAADAFAEAAAVRIGSATHALRVSRGVGSGRRENQGAHEHERSDHSSRVTSLARESSLEGRAPAGAEALGCALHFTPYSGACRARPSPSFRCSSLLPRRVVATAITVRARRRRLLHRRTSRAPRFHPRRLRRLLRLEGLVLSQSPNSETFDVLRAKK